MATRIKGENSDYQFSDGKAVIEENLAASPLYLKLFICPDQMPSKTEALDGKPGRCTGHAAACPGPRKTGHALVHLNQTTGLELVSDKNTIRLAQATEQIFLETKSVEIGKGAAKLVVGFAGNDVTLTNSSGGAAIVLKADGSIEIKPAVGKLVVVSGEMTAKKFTPTG